MSRNRRRSRVLTFLSVVVVAGVSFLAGMAAFNFIMVHSVRHGQEITVPHLEGLPLAEAERVAREVDLRVRKVGERFSTSVPPGFVLEQNPPAARGVKGGRQISVILSGGTETVRVPELTGKSARQAIVLLDGAGLGFGSVSRCPSSRVPAGAVIACTPPAGAVLERGRRVDVLESLGLPELRFMMPDLTGRDEDVVRRKLESLGLSVLLSRQFSPSGQAGPWAVVRQQPSRGTIVCEGDTVRLIARAR